MAAGLPAGSALLAYPFFDMGLLMAAHRKQQQPDSGGAQAEQRREIRNKMEQMGLDPEQRRFIEQMLDGEDDTEGMGEAPSE